MLKSIWKKLLISGKVVVQTTKRIPLFVIGSSKTIEKTICNVTAGDFQLYGIQGIHLIDDPKTGHLEFEGFGTIPVIGENYERFILDNNIGELLIAVTPGAVEPGVMERLNANAVGLNIVVESAIGFQPEDQYILNVGIYKTLSVGAFTFTPWQVLYLGIKRVIDFVCGLVGLALLIPFTILIKIANLLTHDHGKVFYRQKRVGKNGKPIRIWKYRSMIPDADAQLQ